MDHRLASNMVRPKVPLISRRAVVEAALRIVDTEGADALSIRRLGTELEVSGVSLYHHYRDKDEILDDLVITVLGNVRLVEEPVADWKEYFVDAELAYRTAVAQHPNIAPILIQQRPRRFDLPVYDQGARILAEAGIPDEYIWTVIDGLEAIAIGSVLLAMPSRNATRPPSKVPKSNRALRRVLKAGNHLDEVESFELAVRLFLNGVENWFF
jgi:TetR/AcrR family transcriptional regulator, tetracycline repressor protein